MNNKNFVYAGCEIAYAISAKDAIYGILNDYDECPESISDEEASKLEEIVSFLETFAKSRVVMLDNADAL